MIRRRVHRRPPPNPTQFQNLELWFDAESVGISDGTGLGTWNDRSGFGRTMTQATGANQPTVRQFTGGGSRPCVEWDGTNDYMANSSVTVPTGDYTLMVMWETSSQAVTQYMMDSESGRLVFAGNKDGSDGYYDGSWETTTQGTGANRVQTWRLRASPGGEVFTRGKLFGSALSYTQKALGSRLAIGAAYDGTNPGQFLNGKINHLAVWSRALSDPERLRIESHWLRRFGGLAYGV